VTAVEFWFDGEHFVLNTDDWDEFNSRWPDDVEKPNPGVAERIVREIADPVNEGGES
jgi:hypothetical protein